MALETLDVELTVVLGTAWLPLDDLLGLGRGALIALEDNPGDVVDILANGLLIARGRIAVDESGIRVEVSELVRKPDITRARGSTVGERFRIDASLLGEAATAAAA